MNDVQQLASAMLAITFAAVMLVAGQLYIENRSVRLTAVPAALTASVPWDPRTYLTESRRREPTGPGNGYAANSTLAKHLMISAAIGPSPSLRSSQDQ
jgi:hypothetical protein